MLAVPAHVRVWDPSGPPLYTARVSRTVQSTDLFGPYAPPKVTNHSIAEYQKAAPSLGGQYWGEKLTEYGGLGGHAFLGQQRVRDLFVSRSHRHYGSGVTKPTTYDQPYRLTALNKSGCRINDERLSAPLKTNLDILQKQQASWPGNHPYLSHRSMFEVFPDVKTKDSTDIETDGRSSYSSCISNSYDDALRRLHTKLYHTSLYQDSYHGHVREIPQRASTHSLQAPALGENDAIPSSRKRDVMVTSVPLSGRGGLKGGNRAYVGKEGPEDADGRKKSEDGGKDSGDKVEEDEDNAGDDREEEEEEEKEKEEKEEEEKEEEEKEEEGISQIERDDAVESEVNSSQSDPSEQRSILISEGGQPLGTGLPKSSKTRSTGAKRSVSFNDTPQVQILDSPETYGGGFGLSQGHGGIGEMGGDGAPSCRVPSSLAGTGPCWPPSTSLVIENIRGSQLLERRDIAHPPAAPQRADPLRKLLSSSKIGEHVGAGGRLYKFPSVPIPTSLTSGSVALTRLGVDSAANIRPKLPENAPRFSEELRLRPLDPAQLKNKQHNQPFVIPPSYRSQPIKPSGSFGSLRGLRGASLDPVLRLQDELARRIMVRKDAGATPLVLPPAPLSECLTPSGSKTPHRLGLRFKTEAHKRYHTMNPEQTPDLRSTRHSGRKCFFEGDHSSVFRG